MAACQRMPVDDGRALSHSHSGKWSGSGIIAEAQLCDLQHGLSRFNAATSKAATSKAATSKAWN